MAGIRRFVTYIYKYESGEKGENTGFAKIEIRGRECRIEIHFKDMPLKNGEGKIYVFQEKNQKLVMHLIGKMQIMNGCGSYGTEIEMGRQEGISDFTQIDGLCIREKNNGLYLTKWTEGNKVAVLEENLVVADEKESDQSKITTDAKNQTEKVKVKINQEEDIQPKKEQIRATEIPMKNIFPQFNWNDTWERMAEEHEIFQLADDREITYIRIELKELRELPGKYWYLGNNSFLLHGFFNYHYLILGKFREERWFIGIPGIYQRQERVMAAIFGFPEFFVSVDEHGDNDRQRKNVNGEPENQFGYWYHTLDE